MPVVFSTMLQYTLYIEKNNYEAIILNVINIITCSFNRETIFHDYSLSIHYLFYLLYLMYAGDKYNRIENKGNFYTFRHTCNSVYIRLILIALVFHERYGFHSFSMI